MLVPRQHEVEVPAPPLDCTFEKCLLLRCVQRPTQSRKLPDEVGIMTDESRVRGLTVCLHDFDLPAVKQDELHVNAMRRSGAARHASTSAD
jgi:hypothetical protein